MPYCPGRLWLGRSKAKRCMITYVPFCRIDILPYSSLPVWLSSVCRHTFIWRSYFIIFRPKPPHHNNVCKDTSISPTIANDFCAICVRMSGYALLPNWRWRICEKMWKIRSSISKSIHIWDLGLSPLERAHFIYPESVLNKKCPNFELRSFALLGPTVQQFYGCFMALRFALITNQIARILVGVVDNG